MEGLEKFREAFAPFAENYVIIGGTACQLVLEGTEMRPRATKDIDMIVIVERMTTDFARRFWQFVREAGYRPEKHQREEGMQYEMYRFVDGKEGYPYMIELLSRKPDILGLPEGLTIAPMPLSAEYSSLSAIIMDDAYYRFTLQHSRLHEGLRHADEAALIALKTHAYLNLLQRRAEGLHVNSHDLRKHRSDVLKSLVVMTDSSIPAPEPIVERVRQFVASLRAEWNTLATPLAQSLDRNESFVEALLDPLENLFVEES